MAKTYESYPAWIVTVTNSFNIFIYALGAYILLGFGVLVSLLYLLYCFLIEFSVLREGCVGCYYYGKCCACGKGVICARLFKKGDPKIFQKTVTWTDFLPSTLVALMPVVGGVILLLSSFDWILLILTAGLLPMHLAGNAILHGSLICNHCKQGEIGCSACEFFDKKK